MKLFSLGGTQVRCSPFVLLLLPAAIVSGCVEHLIVCLLSLALHESAHALFAHRLGISVSSVEIRPFGFLALFEAEEAAPTDLASVYASGPVASLMLAASSALLSNASSSFAPYGEALMRFNLLLAGINLLPAFPLDGGRLLLCAFRGRTAIIAHKILKVSGMVLGAAFIFVFAFLLIHGEPQPTFAVFGSFLLSSAIREKPQNAPVLIAKKRLGPNASLPVSHIAVSSETTVSQALRLLPKGGFSILVVTDRALNQIGVLNEKQLLFAAQGAGSSSTLANAVAFCRGKMI